MSTDYDKNSEMSRYIHQELPKFKRFKWKFWKLDPFELPIITLEKDYLPYKHSEHRSLLWLVLILLFIGCVEQIFFLAGFFLSAYLVWNLKNIEKLNKNYLNTRDRMFSVLNSHIEKLPELKKNLSILKNRHNNSKELNKYNSLQYKFEETCLDIQLRIPKACGRKIEMLLKTDFEDALYPYLENFVVFPDGIPRVRSELLWNLYAKGILTASDLRRNAEVMNVVSPEVREIIESWLFDLVSAFEYQQTEILNAKINDIKHLHTLKARETQTELMSLIDTLQKAEKYLIVTRRQLSKEIDETIAQINHTRDQIKKLTEQINNYREELQKRTPLASFDSRDE